MAFAALSLHLMILQPSITIKKLRFLVNSSADMEHQFLLQTGLPLIMGTTERIEYILDSGGGEGVADYNLKNIKSLNN